MERDNKKTVAIFKFYFFRTRLNEGHIANVPSAKSVRRFICCPEFYFSLKMSSDFEFSILQRVCNFIKKETLAQALSCEICKIFKNASFTEHLRTTTSGVSGKKKICFLFQSTLCTFFAFAELKHF